MSGIKFYGAQWCGDCRRSKAFLERNNIEFDYIDLEVNPEQVEEVLKLNDGKRVIPTIVFADGTHLTEPSDIALGKKLGI